MKKLSLALLLCLSHAPSFGEGGDGLEGSVWRYRPKGVIQWLFFWNRDYLVFQSGNFMRAGLKDEGFSPALYSARKTGEGVLWKASLKNAKSEAMSWEGKRVSYWMTGTFTRGGSTKRWKAWQLFPKPGKAKEPARQEIAFLEGRIYDHAAKTMLSREAARTVVWGLDGTVESHKDPKFENFRLRPDFVEALKIVQAAGLEQVLWSKAERGWVEGFFERCPEAAPYFSRVITAENYLKTEAGTPPAGKDLSLAGYRVIIDDNTTAVPALAREKGFTHILVPKAFSVPEGDVLLKAAHQAVDLLRVR